MRHSLASALKQLCALLLSECIAVTTVPMPALPADAAADDGSTDSSSEPGPAAHSRNLPTPTASASLKISPELTPSAGTSRVRKAAASIKAEKARSVDIERKSRTSSPDRQTPKTLRPSSHIADIGALGSGFVENKGQWDQRAKFQLKVGGKILWLTENGVMFDNLHPKPGSQASKPRATGRGIKGVPTAENFERFVFAETFVGAHTASTIEPKDVQPGDYNYFVGNDPAKWHTNVKAFNGVVYHDVWEGVDVRVARNGTDIEQEFVVHPGADLGQVQVSYNGIDGLEVAKDGSLLVHTAYGDLRETAPRIYQEIAGKQVAVPGNFKLVDQVSYRFDVGSRDSQHALLIDPTLLYSTYLGGNGGGSCNFGCGSYDQGDAIAVDTSGSAYVTGLSGSTDWPVTVGAFETTATLGVFVTKLNPLGSQLVYSTAISGNSSDHGYGIAVDSGGEAYIVGIAGTGYPTTSNAYQLPCASAGSAFLTKLSAAGDSILYSTCLANSSLAQGVALDSSGRAYVAGYTSSAGLPTTAGAFQPSIPTTTGANTGFLTLLDPSASGTSSLIYSTYLGGSAGGDIPAAVAVDSFGMAYFAGHAASADFPVTPGAYQTTFANPSSGAAFVAKLNPNASGSASLIYSTFVGGTGYSTATGVAVDSLGDAYITGAAVNNFPVSGGPFTGLLSGAVGSGNGGFIAKVNPAGNGLVYSSFLGADGGIVGTGVASDALGDAYVTGYEDCRGGRTNTIQTTPDALQPTCVGTDGQNSFVMKIDPSGTLVYSSYFGAIGNAAYIGTTALGIAADATGDAYITGFTVTPSLPVTQGAFQLALDPNFGGNQFPADAFVTKFPLSSAGGLTVTGILPNAGGNAGTATVTIVGSGFHDGATVRLTGAVNISGTTPILGTRGRTMRSTFDLMSASPGTMSLVVTNPDGTSVTLPSAFTIQQGGAPDIRIQKIGTVPVHLPTGTAPPGVQYAIVVQNFGNIDAASGTVSESLGPESTLMFFDPPGVAEIDPSASVSAVLWPVSLGPGATSVLRYSTSENGAVGSTVVGGPACYIFGGGLATFPSCLIANCPGAASVCVPVLGCSTLSIACLLLGPGSARKCLSTCLAIVGTTVGGTPQACVNALIQCPNSTYSACASHTSQLCTQLSQPLRGIPYDPNYLQGTVGVGPQSWVSGAGTLGYLLHFQNDPTATAPAASVVLAVPIDPVGDITSVGLATISLPGVTVPVGTTFSPRSGLEEFTTNVDLRPSQNLFVLVDAKLDPVGRTLTWTLTSIDPSTGLPVSPGVMGFLPPGAEGSVFFTLNPLPGLATGTTVSEQGSVVFNTNAPVPTAVWTNTLDNTPPTSHVTALPANESSTSFNVQWSGTDVGAGIQYYTVYASDNGGPFTPFQTNTTATSAMFTGQVGHTYGFYSIARDLVGNVEAAKTTAEATTLVSTGTPPAITSANSVTFTFGTPGSFTVMATGLPTPTLSATGVPSGATLVDNGNGTATLSETTAATGTYLITISASNVVGSPATQSFTLTINRANQTITFSGVPASASFGQGPFKLTASATSGLPVFLAATGNCSLSANSLSLTAIGSCTVTSTQPGNGNYNAAPSLSPSFPIGQATTATTVTVSPGTVEYSDYTTLAATVSPVSAGGQALTGTVQFFLNGNAVGSPAVINSSGGATLSQLQVNLSAASYPVKAVFSSTNQNFAGSTGTTTQNVTQENAFILYSGDTIAQVGTSLNLRATVWDSAATGYPGVNPESGPTATIGDITKIWIAFDIYPAGSCASGTPSTLYAQAALTGTPGIGTATTTLSSSSEVSYCVVSRLVAANTGGTNLFYTAPNAETAGLDFYVNSGQFATGGGWVNDPTGSHGNFGFNARYNSAGSPKGQMVYVFRSSYNGVFADFIIKSNALSALQFSGTTYPISSTLQGKVNVQVNRASDGLSLFSAGNYTFSATVTDSGQNGATGKLFSLTVYASNGVPYHQVASNTPLQGGNVVVHPQ